MSILGLTIDYGPYGWLEGYDPTWTPNTTDAQGRRYSYGNQPYMAQWNLTQLANALYPLIGETQPLKEALDVYGTTFQESWQITMAAKIGLKNREPEDGQLINNLLELLTKTETDMTIFFRRLALVNARTTQDDAIDILHEAYYKPEELNSSYRSEMIGWLVAYRSRLAQDNADDRQRLERMNRVNPKYVFRNYLAQQAIDKAEQGDF
jgi:uncharacterized protein YdiU (UPF0061 family)